MAVLAVGVAGLAHAGGGLRALDYHATVVNGRIVGSAFLIGEGLAVTNRHVVTGLRPGAAVGLTASGGGRARAEGRLIAVSGRMDLALLRVPAGFLPRIADDAQAAAGLPVSAAGLDAGSGPATAVLLELDGQVVEPDVTIAAFGPGLIARLPGARPGVSGGPMLDARGRLVGMVTAIRPGTGAAQPLHGPDRLRPAVEAFVLRAPELRAEARRLLGRGRS